MYFLCKAQVCALRDLQPLRCHGVGEAGNGAITKLAMLYVIL